MSAFGQKKTFELGNLVELSVPLTVCLQPIRLRVGSDKYIS